MDWRRMRPVTIVIGCMIGLSLNIVPAFSTTFTVFMKPMAADLGWTRTQLVLGSSVASAAVAVAVWPVGWLIDRYSPRSIILFGIPLFGSAMASLALVPASFASYILICTLIGITAAGCFHTVYISLLVTHFDKKVGLALGTTIAGAAVGQVVLPSYSRYLIDGFGWREAYVLLALTIVVIGWANAWLLPSGTAKTPTGRSEPKDQPGITPRDALRSLIFWRLLLCYLLLGAFAGGHLVSLVPLLTDRGISPTVATAMFGLIGFSSIVARLATGYFLDRMNAGLLGVVTFGVGISGAVLLIISNNPVTVMIAISAIGVMVGAESDLAVYITLRLFGRRFFGTINAIVYSSLLVGILTGPLVFSLSFDEYGSYLPGEWLIIGGALVACIMHFNILSNARTEFRLTRH